jgi:hypothetical protein
LIPLTHIHMKPKPVSSASHAISSTSAHATASVAVRVLKGFVEFFKASMIAVGCFTLIFEGCQFRAAIIQKRLLKEGAAIVEEIQRYRNQFGHLPKSLKELKLPPSAVDPRWEYSSNEGGEFVMVAYIGWGRVCIRYRNEPGDPDSTGWFLDREERPECWTRLTPF